MAGKKKKIPPEASPVPPTTPEPASPSIRLTEDQQGQHREEMTRSAAAPGAQKEERDTVRLDMMRSIVTEPLLSKVQTAKLNGLVDARFDVIIVLNEIYSEGIDGALQRVKERADEWKVRYTSSSHYLFACLTVEQIFQLADEARQLIRDHGPKGTVIYRIWEDTEIAVTLTRSVITIKGDAALRSFAARGDGIVWAILDSGIAEKHPHFKWLDSPHGAVDTLNVASPLQHLDFTPAKNGPLVDAFGHGTHVAGIVAGCWKSKDLAGEMVAGTELRNEADNKPMPRRELLHCISGVAPTCKLVSMKVIADHNVDTEPKQAAGQGKVSWVLLALDQIQQWNQYGKRLLIHGVNMSLGYDFDPRWFACGQSPICVEVNRLVKCGVCVVVSAGNSGYISTITAQNKAEAHYSDISITDPGNAALAITVGSTHRESPHLYGVSYFSSRGPTGDGRMKPDLVAPGERIISCAAGLEAQKYGVLKDADGNDVPVLYCEQTGTSMAAPHVSGAIAAFLSVRNEFIGEPEQVKELFMKNTIDLRREPKFQGSGLLDLMKVLQAV